MGETLNMLVDSCRAAAVDAARSYFSPINALGGALNRIISRFAKDISPNSDNLPSCEQAEQNEAASPETNLSFILKEWPRQRPLGSGWGYVIWKRTRDPNIIVGIRQSHPEEGPHKKEAVQIESEDKPAPEAYLKRLTEAYLERLTIEKAQDAPNCMILLTLPDTTGTHVAPDSEKESEQGGGVAVHEADICAGGAYLTVEDEREIEKATRALDKIRKALSKRRSS